MKKPPIILYVSWCVMMVILAGCNGPRKETTDITEKKKLNPISIADSTLFHFWDSFDMQDTVQIKDPDKGEQHLADFIALLATTADSALRDKAVDRMLDKALSNKTSFDHFIKLYEHYLYDGNSPMRNDLIYESVLRYLLKTDLLSDLEKEAYKSLYKLVLRNKVGHTAEDFTFELITSRKQRLSQIEAKFTLLLFYDPDCMHCKETIHQLRDSPQLVQLFAQLRIQIVAIDPWGDRRKWKDYISEIPEQWINGFDSSSIILRENLFDLKASPTIFLLDEHKKVLLKDTDLQQLIQYFIQQLH